VKRWLLCWAAVAASLAQAAAMRPPITEAETEVVDGVRAAVRSGDCALAVKRLNAGLPAKYPDLLLLAGAMYEHGVCLKANWDRAARMYSLAHDVGHQAGAYRLVAGYALPGGQPSAALWWASKFQPSLLPETCRSGVAVVDDVDSFAATLAAWPAARLQGCNYVVGVLAAVVGEMDYPSEAQHFRLRGAVGMSFVPAEPAMTWSTQEFEVVPFSGVVDGDSVRDRNSSVLRKTFERHLESLGKAALQRYPKPAEGVDPGWRMGRQFVFDLKLK